MKDTDFTGRLDLAGLPASIGSKALRDVRFAWSGDTIYADGPITAEVKLADGTVWNNVVTEEVSKVAETLNEYRGRYRYNLIDANVRRMGADVPQIWQWDDHEASNNWSDSKDVSGDKRYTEKNVPLLVARATRAFHEYAPLRRTADVKSERVYRHLPQSPLLDMFVVDMAATAAQLRQPAARRLPGFWMASSVPKRSGKSSPPTCPLARRWNVKSKLHACYGRSSTRASRTSCGMHYTAAHYFDPAQAQFSDFNPSWEFVSGPLNAGSFGPNKTDATFGMQVVYQKAPQEQNTAPTAGLQFFGQVDIDARTQAMTVTLKDLTGASLYAKTLAPHRA